MFFQTHSCKLFWQGKMKLRIYLVQNCFCLYHDFIKVILEELIGRVTKQYCEISRTKAMDHSFR